MSRVALEDVIEDVYPLSPMQQGVLFDSLYTRAPAAYIEQRFCTLSGLLDTAAFERAWQQVVDRYLVLRTSFVWEGVSEPVQVVQRGVSVPLHRLDWSDLPEVARADHLAAYLAADRQRGFDLAQAPLMRLTLARYDDHTYQFIWTYHHLILDGWSWPLLIREIFTFYRAWTRGERVELKPPRQYREYIAWLRQQDLAQAEEYWRATLQTFQAPLTLAFDQKGTAARKREAGHELNERLPESLMTELLAFSRTHQVTLNTLIQGAWALLLHHYSGADDIVFGAVVSGRPPALPEVESLVGLLVNTLPVRVRVPTADTVLSWLRALQLQQAESRQYEYSPLVEVHGWSGVPRGVPLFETILVFENYPLDFSSAAARDASLEGSPADLVISGLQFAEEVTYPLSLVVTPGRELAIRLLYDQARFEAAIVRRISGHLRTLLEAIIADPRQSVASVPILSGAERRQILFDWNDRRAEYPVDRSLAELFEAQVERRPTACALEFQGQSLSYQDLNVRANRVARQLSVMGLGPEDRVALFLPPTPEFITALLGILKAGAAYIPLEPSLPLERLAFMLEEAQPPVLLTQTSLLHRLPSTWAQVLCLDSDWAVFEAHSPHNPRPVARPENAAYVVYTSGSTGQPKAVVVPHRALVNNLSAMNDYYRLSVGDRMLQFVSVSFDVFAQEVFTTLTTGATLVIPPNPRTLSPWELIDCCAQLKISAVHLPPPYWHQVVDELGQVERPVPESLQLLVVGAESPSVAKLVQWARLSRPEARFINAYGPAEAAITNAVFDLALNSDSLEGLNRIPIGRPLPNNRLYLLDKQLRPVPIGTPGGLFIGGEGLARGYLNHPDLTAEKFLPDPYTPQSGARMYRTGDTARFRSDGQLEFMGRDDNQVKLRGYRIELGEVEAVLKQHYLVQEAAAIVREDRPGARQLVGYVTLTPPAQDEREARRQIIEQLKGKLPAYMVPAPLVILPVMPLTVNGKLDRRALPPPAPLQTEAESAYLPPRSLVEEVLAKIWAQVLGVERVGIQQNFFELGGHSLLATQIMSRVRDYFQADVPLSAIFEHPTVAGLALVVMQKQAELTDAAQTDRLLAELESLSEDEADRLLRAELNLTQDE